MLRLAGTCVLLCASIAPAVAEGGEPIRVSVTTPEGCGSVETFVAQLAQRAPVHLDPAATRMFDVTVMPYESGEFLGKLVIRTPGGDSVRTVDAATCEEALAALTVVAALSVTEPVAKPIAIAKPTVEKSRWLAIGGGVARFYGVVPSGELGVPVFVAIGARDRAQLRVAFARTWEQTAKSADGTSDFQWTIGRIDARPLALSRGPLTLAPAIGIEAGALTARGLMVGSPETRTRPWVAPFVAGRVALHLDRMAIELEGILAVPLVRDRFFIAPDTTVHQPRVITGGVAVTVAVELF